MQPSDPSHPSILAHSPALADAEEEGLRVLLGHGAGHAFGAAVPPIFQTSLFLFDDYAEMADAFAGRIRRPIYSRGDNPTVMELERLVAELEGAEAGRAFASGTAAIAATILAYVGSGERLVCVRHVYSDAYKMFEKLFRQLGITVDYVDGASAEAVAAALPGARMLYLESPSSMVFELQDIATLAGLARAAGVVSVIDNSWATPVYQQPHRLGVDLVIHAASKYLSGHSDTVAGIVVGGAAHIERINALTYPYLGAKLSPIEGWLLVRGLRTLPLRLARHQASGLAIARRLMAHPLVERVRHPAFSTHPGRATLKGFTGLFSFDVVQSVDVPAFVDGLRLIRLGVSWGGHESLIVPALAALQQSPGANSFARFGVSPRTVRLHVGLECVELLWADLVQALERAAPEHVASERATREASLVA